MSDPFQYQPAYTLSSEEAELQASSFKSGLLKYYFLPQPHPELPHLQSPAHHLASKMTCMVSKLVLSSDVIEATRILPKASLVGVLPSLKQQAWLQPFL